MSHFKLILVKHSLPKLNPNFPANQWLLSREGKKRCIGLAPSLAPFKPETIFSSCEPKAKQTAEILAKIMNVPVSVEKNLHEHERPQPGLLSLEEFDRNVQALFNFPEETIFGNESAIQAQNRFSEAVMGIIARHQNNNIMIVSHGTVISLFVQATSKISPYPLWKSLELPSFIVLSLPQFRLEKVISTITSDTP